MEFYIGMNVSYPVNEALHQVESAVQCVNKLIYILIYMISLMGLFWCLLLAVAT